MTQAEMIEVMEIYIKPIYEIIGATVAFLVITISAVAVFYGVRVIWARYLQG